MVSGKLPHVAGWSVWVVLLAILGFAAPARADEVPGYVPASFHVSANGEAVYNIPIQLPPANFQPDVALAYNSSSPDGPLGKGWVLTGVSAITRCRANQADDGFRGAVNYTNTDRYCLDGQRLINVHGPYGSPGSKYRTALETWRDVTASADACGSGPCSFTVRTRDGSVWTYGAADSRILAVGRNDVRVWAVKEIVNRNGNRVTYSYSSDPTGSGKGRGDYYVTAVAYGDNVAAPSAAPFAINFAYVDRPDPLPGYVGGSPVEVTALLSTVTTGVGGVSVLQYRLAYQTGALSGGSRIHSVAICDGTNASAKCLGKTTAAWSDGKVEAAAATLPALPGGPYKQTLVADLNGDGRGDLLTVTEAKGTWSIRGYLSNGAGLVACPASVTVPATAIPLQVGDTDGSGAAGLLQLYPAGDGTAGARWISFGPDGCTASTRTQALPTVGSASDRNWAIDVNGDGRTDFLVGRVSQGTLALTALLSTGTGFNPVPAGAIPLQPRQTLIPMDVNADGLVDMVQAYSAGGLLQITTYLSNGTGYTLGKTSSAAAGGTDVGLWPMEMSGDGLPALVRGWASRGSLQLSVLVADGAGGFVAGATTATGRAVSSHDSFYAQDFFGVGRSSLLQLVTRSGTVSTIAYRVVSGALDRGTDLTAQLPAGGASTWGVDLSGAGRIGVLRGSNAAGQLTLSRLQYQGPHPDTLASVTDGMGGTIRITYAPMSDRSVYTPAKGTTYPAAAAGRYSYARAPAQAPFQRVGGGSTYIVAGYRKSSSTSGGAYDYAYSYSYAGGLNDLGGRGWLGFSDVSETAPDGLVTSRHLNQIYPLTGTIAVITKSCDPAVATDPLCGTGTPLLLSRSVTGYTTNQTAAPGPGAARGPLQILKWQVRFESYVYGTLDSARARTYDHDAFGDVTRRVELGYVDAAGRSLDPGAVYRICSAYSNDVGNWKLGRLSAVKASAAAACVPTDPFKAGDLRLETLTYSSAGNLATHALWDDQNNAFQTTSYLYDSYGNLARSTEPGGRTTTYGVDPTFHAYTITRSSPPTSENRILTERFGYDPRFGTPTVNIDPRGGVTVTCTDTFGRAAAVQRTTPDNSVPTDPNCSPAGLIGSPAGSGPLANVTISRRVVAGGAPYLEDRARQTWGDSKTPASWQWRRSYLDGMGRPYAVVSEHDPAAGDVLVCNNYDSSDRILWVTAPRFSTASPTTCAPPSSAAPGNSYQFDVYGRPARLASATGPTGSEVSLITFAYGPGDTTLATYAAGDSYRYAKLLKHRHFGEEKRLVSFASPTMSGAMATTSYGYDLLGRLTRVRGPPTAADPQGILTTITYDSLGRRTSIDNPDQNSTGAPGIVATRYSYDSTTGFLRRTVRAGGGAVEFTRDSLGRVVAQAQSDGTAIAFSYDNPEQGGLGRLTAVSATAKGAPLYAYRYGYDRSGERASRTVTLGPNSYTLTDRYDPQGRRTIRTYPNGLNLLETYDKSGLAAQALGTAAITYDQSTAFGRAGRIRFSNGVLATYAYSPTDQLQGWTVTDSAGSALADFALTWDHLGQTTEVTDRNAATSGKFSQAFTHSATRLASATAPGLYGIVKYGYDAEGNMCAVGATCTYAAHRLLSRSGGNLPPADLKYNVDGTVRTVKLGGHTRRFQYDALGRLAAAALDGKTVLDEVVYDYAGRRLHRRSGDEAYDTPFESYQASTGAGGESTILISGPGGTAARVDLTGTTETAEFFHQDQVASTVLATDDLGQVSNRAAYEPFGQLVAGDSDPAGFQDAQPERGAAVDYFGGRYYDPQLGRFITPDNGTGSSIANADTLNRYAFALNDPVSYIDFGGHNIWDEIGAGLVGGLEVAAGVAIDVLSDGALEPVGGALIGGGLGGLQYLATSGGNFSWKQYGIQTGIGAATGLLTGGGGGGEADAGAAAAEDAAETSGSDAAEASPSDLVEDDHPAEARLDSGSRSESGPAEAKNEVGEAQEDAGQGGDGKGDRDEDEDEDEACPVEAGLSGSTLIKGAGGARALASLRVGDEVYGADPRSGLITRGWVSDLHAGSGAGYRLSIDGRPVHAGAAQLFAVAGRGWTAAGAIRVGDRIRRAGGGFATVRAIEMAPDADQLVSIEVAGLHNFALDNGVLVHNGKKCRREAAVGRTPGKNSKTGREVQDRMRKAGDLKMVGKKKFVKLQIKKGGPKVWKDLDENVHMGHKVDAVDYWNKTGYKLGPKAPQVRSFMLDSSNYRLEWGPLNSSNGAQLGQTYRLPLGWPAGTPFP